MNKFNDNYNESAQNNIRLFNGLNRMRFGMKILTAYYSLRIAVCSFLFLAFSHAAYSKVFFFFSWGTEVCIVQEMPNDYTIQTTEYGEIHANLGVVYNEFSLFGIPLWNWNVDTYILLPDDYDSMGMYNVTKVSQVKNHKRDLT